MAKSAPMSKTLPTLTAQSPLGGYNMVVDGASPVAENDEGWVTSIAYSPHLKSAIGLGYIRRGNNRHGDIVRAVNLLGGQDIKVELCSPHFIDPEGTRLHG